MPRQTNTQIITRSWIRLSGYVLYLGLVTGVIYFSLSNRFYDDPFITYRYAHNLAQGAGFVYNPAQHILSTTSPLHVILLAGLSFLWSDLPRLANLLGALSLACGGLLLWDLAQTWGTPSSGWASLALYPTFPLLVSTLGSETPLYLAFCLASFAGYARQRYSLAALFVALAALTRPDGLVVFFLLAFHYLIRVRKPVPWQALAIFFAPILAWTFFSQSYFGSPLPVTLLAKQYQGTMLISQRFAAGFLSLLDTYTRRPYFWLEVIFAAAGIYLSMTRRRSWLLIWAWMVLHFIAYSLLGVSRYFWYYAPLVPGFIAATGLGITGLVELPAPQIKLFQGRVNPSRLLAAAAVLIIFGGQVRELWAIRQAADPRYPVYRAAGEWLQANTPPSAQVGTLEVGIIGYYSLRPVIDFAGLLQPVVARHLIGRSSYEEAARWAIDNFQPDSLVVWDKQFPGLQASYVATHCKLAKEIPTDQKLFGSPLMIYTCYPAR
jgi:hypothetical protein